MTGFVELRVRVAADDAVKVDIVQTELTKLLRATGTQPVSGDATDGSSQATLDGSASIFWMTADVVRTDRTGGRSKGGGAADV